MSIGTELNNPFDIRPDSRWTWRGQLPHASGFVAFDTIENGYRAGLLNLRNTVAAGFNTLRRLAFRYAPPSENDTDAYLAGLCKSTGWTADRIINLAGGANFGAGDLLQTLGQAVLVEEQGMTYVVAIDPGVFRQAVADALVA